MIYVQQQCPGYAVTGISNDVKPRPREHVREDARHRSIRYGRASHDIELKARAKSATTQMTEK